MQISLRPFSRGRRVALIAAVLAAAMLPAAGAVSAGAATAAPGTTTVYYSTAKNWASYNVHFKVGSGTWTAVPGVTMAPACTGWVSKEIANPTSATITAVFTNGSGTWDNNGSKDYTLAGGSYAAVNNGVVTTANPCDVPVGTGEPSTVYYPTTKNWAAYNIHYRVGSGTWTAVPGVAMAPACTGWVSKEIANPTSATITAVFTNGSGTWDNNGSKDYTIAAGTTTVKDGAVTVGSPCDTPTPTPTTDPGPDTVKPSVPTGLVATATGTSITATWAPATDNVAVTGYDVVRAGGAGTTNRLVTTTTLTDASLQPNTAYKYKVRSRDAAGNLSAYSTVVTVTTGSTTPVDTTKPSAPTELVATASGTTATVSWKASTDDVAVASYSVRRTSGTVTVTVPSLTTTLSDTGLTPGATYTYVVTAIDAAGNVSAPSTPVSVTVPPKVTPGTPTGTPLGGDPREDSIYFVMTARFADGDTSNNRGGNMHVKSGNAANNDPMFRGDFAGLVDNLDYIKGLGFSAIWITPVVLNRSDYDFHGYHGWDFYQVDPRLESEGASYQDLIDAAHAKGIKIYQDVVYNHSSRWGAKDLFVPTVYGTRDNQWSWYYDETVAGKEYNPLEEDADGSTYNGDLWSTVQPTNQACKNWGVAAGYSAEGYRTYNCQWPNATSGMFPSNLFHPCWIGNWEGKDAQDCWIHEDLADFNTENAQVQDYLINAYNSYIDMGVDGFRVDTAVHIPRVMWNRHFLPAIQQHAVETFGEKGKDFYVFGEVAQFVHDKWNRGSVNHSAPFYTWDERKEYSLDDVVAAAEQFSYENLMGPAGQPTSTNAVLNGNTYHAPDHSKASGMNIIDMRMHMNFDDASNAFHAGMDSDDATNDATFNAVYVDSHDYGPGKSQTRFSGGTAAWAENMSLMWTFRGIPTLYYGSEIEFMKGAKIDCGPTCPLATTGRAYYGDHLAGTVVASDFGVVASASGEVAKTLEQPLVKHVQRLNLIRRAVPALQKGQYSTQGVSGNMAYKKRFTEGAVDSFVLVAVSGSATFSGIPNGTYVDAVTGDSKTVTNGTLTASVSGQGNMRAYVLNLPGNPAPGKIGADGAYLK